VSQKDGELAGRGARVAARLAFWRLTPENAWRRNLYVVMLAVFVSFTGFTFVMPFLPLYIKQLGVGDEGDAALWAGLIFGISPLISGLLAPVWSMLSERFGRKVMLQRSLAAFVVLIILMAFVTNVYQLTALRLLLGFFGGMGAMSVALASTIAPRNQVGEAVGLIQATQLSSGIAAPFLGGVLVDAFGLHGSFFIASALCAVAFLVITIAYRDEDEQGEARGVEPTSAKARNKPVSSMRQYLYMPIFIGLAVTVFTIQFVDRSFGPLLPLYISTLDAPSGRIGSITGLVMTLGAVAASIAAVQAGRLSSRVDPRPLLLASLAAGAVLCLPLAFVDHWVQLLFIRTLLGLLAGGALTLAYAIGGREMPANAKMGAFGTLAGIGQIGGATSPFITGMLSKWASLSAIFVVDTILYVLLLGWVSTMLRQKDATADPEPDSPLPAATGEAVLAEGDD
jgi:MFS transporter, DHA1 family, multidrug resistance protein